MREQQIQIPISLLNRMVKYIYVEQSEELRQEIMKGLEEKAEAQARRETYTQYKTADSEAAREAARQKYLDMVGIPKDFRR